VREVEFAKEAELRGGGVERGTTTEGKRERAQSTLPGRESFLY